MQDIEYDGWEFRSLGGASNYYGWILRVLAPHLRGRCLEIGSGAGNFTRLLVGGGVSAGPVTCLEPSPRHAALLRDLFGSSEGVSVVESTLEAYLAGGGAGPFDSAVSVNVLEHVEDDLAAVRGIAGLLAPGGRLCLVVPAHPCLYGSLDRVFGHHRRYRLASMAHLADSANLRILDMRYMNAPGALAWLAMGKVLRLRRWSEGSVGLYDKVAIPVIRRLEALCRPPFGQSLRAVLEKG